MTELHLKTPAEHFEYIRSMLRLSFFFARKYLAPKFPEKEIGELIKAHTPAFYHGMFYNDITANWSNHDCQQIVEHANRLKHLTPEDFEEEMWDFVKNIARFRALENYPRSVGVAHPASWHCGSLTYDPPISGDTVIPDNYTAIHIANGVGPHSIFEDQEYLLCCFKLLIKEIEIKYNAKGIYTCTWLNSNPNWLKFFPQEWLDNMEKADPVKLEVPGWSVADWGQIISSRGTIRPYMDEFVRQNGRLKYMKLISYCSLANLKKHLQKF
ncbi:MAG: hypothetical protein IKB71_04750 [Lentisphaeria bacterium]|nr:hypothetical protein [Lentisphaeria bacterium]